MPETKKRQRSALDAPPVQKVRAYALVRADTREACGRLICARSGQSWVATLWADVDWPLPLPDEARADHYTDRDLYANEALLTVVKLALGYGYAYDPEWEYRGADWRTVLEGHDIIVYAVIP